MPAHFFAVNLRKNRTVHGGIGKNTAARCGTDFQQIETVGVCIPGSIDAQNGTVVNAYNLGFHNVPFRQIVKETFNKPAAMLNDADAAALAEHRLGVLRGTRNSLLVTLGTGFGGGIILNGEIFCGGRGFGVELGHIQMDMHGEKCTCGRRGCIETLCAASRLTRDALRLAEKRNKRVISSVKRCTMPARSLQRQGRGILNARRRGIATLMICRMRLCPLSIFLTPK